MTETTARNFQLLYPKSYPDLEELQKAYIARPFAKNSRTIEAIKAAVDAFNLALPSQHTNEEDGETLPPRTPDQECFVKQNPYLSSIY